MECENCILADSTASGKAITNTLEMLEASRFELLAGLAQSELDLISEAITVEAYAGGEHIVQAGGEIEVYLLQRGQASAVITLRSGREARLATFSAGMSFGEMALIGNRQRSATGKCPTLQCNASSWTSLPLRASGLTIRG